MFSKWNNEKEGTARITPHTIISILLVMIFIFALLLCYTLVHTEVLFTGNYADFGNDIDEDGLFETLIVETQVYVVKPGYYSVGATLSSSTEAMIGGDIDGSQTYVYLNKGLQTVQLIFEGKYIRLSKVDGPYLLSDLWVTDTQNPSPTELREHVLDSRVDSYETTHYKHTEFQEP